MDEKFQLAIEKTLANEGGYVDDPDDPGGATNLGISLRYLAKLGVIDPEEGYLLGDMDGDGDVDADDIRLMSRDEAIKIYRSQWWDRYRYGDIAAGDVAAKTFDLSVNMGPKRLHLLLQRAINRISHADLSVDGNLGPKTLNAVNQCKPSALLNAVIEEAVAFYEDLARRKKLGKYLKGWLRRARL